MYAELRFRVLFFSPHFFLGHDELYISLIGSTCMFLLNSMQLRSTTTWIHVREELAPLKGWTSLRGYLGAVVALTLPYPWFMNQQASQLVLGIAFLLPRGPHKS